MKQSNVLVIDRSKWRTGGKGVYKTGTGRTDLRNTEEYMCCLGFECQREGVNIEKLKRIGTPHGCAEFLPEDSPLLYSSGENSKFSDNAMEVNDDESTTALEKEILITKLFSEKGIKVKFINQYPKGTIY